MFMYLAIGILVQMVWTFLSVVVWEIGSFEDFGFYKWIAIGGATIINIILWPVSLAVDAKLAYNLYELEKS